MQKELKTVLMIMLSISMILGICSCRIEESYKEFDITGINYNVNDDYFTSEEYSFARIQNVVIIPEIKAINHGEYVIYISAYSKNGKEIGNREKITKICGQLNICDVGYKIQSDEVYDETNNQTLLVITLRENDIEPTLITLPNNLTESYEI